MERDTSCLRLSALANGKPAWPLPIQVATDGDLCSGRGFGKGALFWSCYSSTLQVQVRCSYAMFRFIVSLPSFRCFTGRKKEKKGKDKKKESERKKIGGK
jgi:hypothetical protein